MLAHVNGDEAELPEHARTVVDAYAGRREGGREVRAGGRRGRRHGPGGPGDRRPAAGRGHRRTADPLLLVVSGSVVAALLPLAVVITAIAGTFAGLPPLGGPLEVSMSAADLTTARGPAWASTMPCW